jgi:positive regulator of sigma E activity
MSQLITALGSVRADNSGVFHAEFERRSGCARCAQAPVCGTGVLQKVAGIQRRPLADDLPAALSGDVVEASISAPALLGLTALCYLLPAVLGVLGAWCASQVLPWNPDLAALFGLFAGLVGAIVLLRAAGIDTWAHANISFSRASSYNSHPGL